MGGIVPPAVHGYGRRGALSRFDPFLLVAVFIGFQCDRFLFTTSLVAKITIIT